jgi:hypothetical protein
MNYDRARLQGDRMASNVNLDALIPREDFEVASDAEEVSVKDSMPISDLQIAAQRRKLLSA